MAQVCRRTCGVTSGAEPSRAHSRLEALAHAFDRLPIPLDHRSLREPVSRPATQVGKQPRREPYRRLPLLRLPAADCAAIEHALLEVDVAAAYSRRQRRPADRRRPRAGVEANQDETGDVAADRPQRVLVTHDLPGPPRGPQEASRLGPRKPPLARRRPWWQHDRHDLGAQALPPVMIDRRPQIFELASRRRRRHHAGRRSGLIRLRGLPRLGGAVLT